MSDPALKAFEDLDYPGRRRPVNRVAKQASDDTALWDEKPYMAKLPGGTEKQEFFLISHLAKALDYSVQSIRAWEAARLLPKTPYRSPRTKSPTAAIGGNKGKRLWTREQIEGILRLATRHGVILNKKPPTTAFARDVARLFNELAGEQNR